MVPSHGYHTPCGAGRLPARFLIHRTGSPSPGRVMGWRQPPQGSSAFRCLRAPLQASVVEEPPSASIVGFLTAEVGAIILLTGMCSYGAEGAKA